MPRKKIALYSKFIVEPLLDFVIDEIAMRSKQTFETARFEYERNGRGAYVILLDEAHLFRKKQFALFFNSQAELTKYKDSQELQELVTTYDPICQFVIFSFFASSELKLMKPMIVHRDAHELFDTALCTNPKPLEIIDARRCNHCTATTPTLKQCANCRTVMYCSKQCQVKDWTTHKQICNTVRN